MKSIFLVIKNKMERGLLRSWWPSAGMSVERSELNVPVGRVAELGKRIKSIVGSNLSSDSML